MCQRNTLSAILRTGNLSDALGRNITCSRKTLGFVDHCLTDHRAVLQHILQIYQTTVVHMLGKVICIVKMDNSFLMRLDHFRRQKETSCNILADLPCHIVTLNAVDSGILIGIFLFHFLIIALDQA